MLLDVSRVNNLQNPLTTKTFLIEMFYEKRHSMFAELFLWPEGREAIIKSNDLDLSQHTLIPFKDVSTVRFSLLPLFRSCRFKGSLKGISFDDFEKYWSKDFIRKLD